MPLAWNGCPKENVGKEPGTVHGSLHGPGYSGGNPLTGQTASPANGTPLQLWDCYAGTNQRWSFA